MRPMVLYIITKQFDINAITVIYLYLDNFISLYKYLCVY